MLSGSGDVPGDALSDLASTARDRGAATARAWPRPTPRARETRSLTADFTVSGVRLVPGPGLLSADRWVAYGTLTAVTGRLRWDDEPR